MKTLDINADLGEGIAADAELMEIVSSANICCGLHAGGPVKMMQAITIAHVNNIAVGAHPGFNDRENFGRAEREIGEFELLAELLYQLGAFSLVADALKTPGRYIKPHGALYNMACRLDRFAEPVAQVAMMMGLPVLALPNSELEKQSRAKAVAFFREGFADRRYDEKGKLVARDLPNAFIHDPAEAVDQVHRLIEEQEIQSICIHGDNPQAVLFARTLRKNLESAGYEIKPFA